jgi:hypothetical protein
MPLDSRGTLLQVAINFKRRMIASTCYSIERIASEKHVDAPARQLLRHEQARPILVRQAKAQCQ